MLALIQRMRPIGYCYTCDRQIEIILTSPTTNTCSSCSGEFVEVFELSEPTPTPSTHEADVVIVINNTTVPGHADGESDYGEENGLAENNDEPENTDQIDELLDLINENDETVAGSFNTNADNDKREAEPSNKRPRLEKKEEVEEDIVSHLIYGIFISLDMLFILLCVWFQTCTICFDQWTNSGPHRLVSLKCGHLFGESCITRWIHMNKKCAQCNAPNQVYDIRKLFAKCLKAVDAVNVTAFQS